MRLSPAWKSFIPAAILAALVLGVFYQLQNYGPESAVRRLHEAVLNRNQAEVEEVITQPYNISEVAAMEALILNTLSAGASVRMRDVTTSEPNVVLVTVVYRAPGGSGSATYQTQKTPDGWKVDVHGTWKLWHSVTKP